MHHVRIVLLAVAFSGQKKYDQEPNNNPQSTDICKPFILHFLHIDIIQYSYTLTFTMPSSSSQQSPTSPSSPKKSKKASKSSSSSSSPKKSKDKKKKHSSTRRSRRRSHKHHDTASVGSTSFAMMKQLETKSESQKIKMAGFLRELHRMAMEDNKEKMKASWDDLHFLADAKDNRCGLGDGSVTLDDVPDLANLTPAQALTKIHALHALHDDALLDSLSVVQLVRAATQVLAQEETVLDLTQTTTTTTSKISIVGDLHGSLGCLMQVLQLIKIDELAESSSRMVIFNGDYVDRGQHSLLVLETLLLLKLAHPQQVFLLRGNHEDTTLASTYGFRDEIEQRYDREKEDEIWHEMGLLFAAFPLCAVTRTACIVHGGIPEQNFDLQRLRKISKSVRCELKTVADPYDEDEELARGILWSDPSDTDGIGFNDRGAGALFGPDVTRDFLDRHKLKLLIRAHEPFEDGHCHHHDCGDGRGAVTVFSVANYPNGEGTNRGAVMKMNDRDGTYKILKFRFRHYHDQEVKTDDDASESMSMSMSTEFGNHHVGDHYRELLTELVEGNRSRLTKSFRRFQDKATGTVLIADWAEIMSLELDMKDTPWLEIQPEVAPAIAIEEGGDANRIDWNQFMEEYSNYVIPNKDLLPQDQLLMLHQHKDKLLQIFKLFDTDQSGAIDEQEFIAGMKMLSEQFPELNMDMSNESDLKALFQALDEDRGGDITIDEFMKALQNSDALFGLVNSLDRKQVSALQENQEMLLLAFKYLDSDRSGAIDMEEFRRGIELLNKRLPERQQFGDPEELFRLLDADGSGEIDLQEFNQIFNMI